MVQFTEYVKGSRGQRCASAAFGWQRGFTATRIRVAFQAGA